MRAKDLNTIEIFLEKYSGGGYAEIGPNAQRAKYAKKAADAATQMTGGNQAAAANAIKAVNSDQEQQQKDREQQAEIDALAQKRAGDTVELDGEEVEVVSPAGDTSDGSKADEVTMRKPDGTVVSVSLRESVNKLIQLAGRARTDESRSQVRALAEKYLLPGETAVDRFLAKPLSEQLLALEHLDPPSVRTKVFEGAVPDNSSARMLNKILGDHFPVGDYGKQMEAYIALPVPSMLRDFWALEANEGPNACARWIVREYVKKFAPDSFKGDVKLNESRLVVEDDLEESVGFPNRKRGEEYINPHDESDIVLFEQLHLLPEIGNQFSSPEERDGVLDQFLKDHSPVFMINKPNRGLLGLYIVELSKDGKSEYYVKFVRNLIKVAGVLNSIPAGIKAPNHGGYVLNTAVARSENMPIKPSDVFSKEGPFTAEQIVKAIANRKDATSVNNEVVDQMVHAITQIANGVQPVIVNGAQYRELHEKYLNEFAGPLALKSGFVHNSEVLDSLFDSIDGNRADFDKVIFPSDVRGMLVDSYLTDGTTRIGISSKAKRGGGAAASIGGLAMMIDKHKNEKAFKESVINEYPDIIELIQTLHEKKAVEGLLWALRKFDLIDAGDEKIIKTMIKNVVKGEPEKNTEDILTDRLQGFIRAYKADDTNPKYSLAFHTLAATSRQLSAYAKQLPFTEAVKAILAHASVIQVYMSTKKKGNDLVVDPFHLVWPGDFSGEIALDTAKNFTGTEVRGKVNFKIRK